jgi:hypothetical protein
MILYDLEIPEMDELKQRIESEDGEWFLGGEEFMWNSAIEKGLPKLERMIKKDDGFYMHQLKYGASKDARFSLF